MSWLELYHHYTFIFYFLKTAPAYIKELISYIKSAGTGDTADIEYQREHPRLSEQLADQDVVDRTQEFPSCCESLMRLS